MPFKGVSNLFPGYKIKQYKEERINKWENVNVNSLVLFKFLSPQTWATKKTENSKMRIRTQPSRDDIKA